MDNTLQQKTTFALYFGNRGFFPEKLIALARKEMIEAVTAAGYSYIIPDEDMTRFGAVETRKEGKAYASWLAQNSGKYDGVIICLPNFGDENGAVSALENCDKPILIQAYPDEIGKMDFENRRDSYCGKFSISDVFYQYGIPYTLLEPHVVHPLSQKFSENLHEFASICNVVNGMKKFSIGVLGARTTAFKTVRYDEISLQKYGITVETFDLSSLLHKVSLMSDTDKLVLEKVAFLKRYTNCSFVPEDKMLTLGKVFVGIEEYISEYDLDGITIRCWEEMQQILGIAPCVLLSAFNDRGMVASCEVDLNSAICMRAVQLASSNPAACLDWNNNYGDDPNKVILFHCGPVAQTLMKEKGTVTDHKMFAKTCPGRGWGSNEGRIDAFPMTFLNCKTENGKLEFYVGEGEFLDDEIEEGFFGCGGVAKIENLQHILNKLGKNGYRHHTVIGKSHVSSVLLEAFKTYLNYELLDL